MNSERNEWIKRAYILAGGKSSRFGYPKALVDTGEGPLISRLCRRLIDRGIEPTIVAKRKEDFAQFGWLCIEDEIADAGPLHGIERSLKDCQRVGESHCWILTCDLWDWNTEWEKAASRISEKLRVRCDALLLETGSPFTPFPGIYGISALPSIQEAWGQGIRSVRSWQTSIHDRIIRVPIITEAYPQTFNTAEELAKLRSMFES